MTELHDRAQCPVCLCSVRVADGVLVQHTRRSMAHAKPVSWCAGSGRRA